MSNPEHLEHVDRDPDGWTVWCECGWEANGPFRTKARAQDAWEDHCDVAFMEATMEGAGGE